MPSAATLAAYKLTRDLWPQKSIYDELFQSSPIIGIFQKDTNFVERTRYIDVGYAAGQGIAPDFPTAKQFKSPSRAVEFAISTVPYYGAFSIDGVLGRKAKFGGNKALIVDPMKRDSRNLMRQVKNDLSSYFHGNGGGSLARFTAGTTVSTATGTLLNTADKRRLEPGMALWLSTADGTSGAVKAGYITIATMGGTLSAPTITTDQASIDAGVPTAAASDYLFRAGVFGNVVDGLESWCPNHSGAPGTFKGVNRNLYADRLAGYVIDGRKVGPRQRALQAARFVADAGFNPDTYLMSTRNWEALHNELQSAGSLRFSKVPAASVGSYKVGVTYEAISLTGPTGELQIFADPWMPDDVERCMERGMWTIGSTGDLVHWDDDVGPDSPMVEETADAREVRLVGDIAFYTEAPAANCRVQVTP